MSSHYERLRDRFGAHLEKGCACENILIATDSTLESAALSKGLIIEASDGTRGHLAGIRVAHLCLAFGTYALNQDGKPSDAMLKETRKSLGGGTRGFYCEWTGAPVVVRPRDRVFVE